MTDYLAAAASPAVPQQPVRKWDVVLGWVLYVIAVVLGVFAALLTPLFGFLTDPCAYRGRDCAYGYLDWGMGLSWGGAILALVAGWVMLVYSTVKGRMMWYWPVLSMVIVIASFIGGLFVAAHVTG